LKPIEEFVNQVIHGDCITVMQTMASESVDLVVTDPPYLVNYRPRDGRLCANDDTAACLAPSFREAYRVLKPDRFCLSFYGWPWIQRFMAVWKECGFRPVSHFSWPKSYCSREGYSHSYHEVGYLLAKGSPPKPEEPPSDVLHWENTGNILHPRSRSSPSRRSLERIPRPATLC
jgi:DNA modification methylase